MKKTMLYLILAVVAICSAAVIAHAFIKRTDNTVVSAKGPDGQGHVLTNLWKNYYAAQKADLPKKMSESLDVIMEQAKAKRYHWDFYDAAVKKVDAEVSRNWRADSHLLVQVLQEREWDDGFRLDQQDPSPVWEEQRFPHQDIRADEWSPQWFHKG